MQREAKKRKIMSSNTKGEHGVGENINCLPCLERLPSTHERQNPSHTYTTGMAYFLYAFNHFFLPCKSMVLWLIVMILYHVMVFFLFKLPG